MTDAADFRPSSTPASRNGGASVDLWRRVAEEMHWRYQFILVSHMDAILAGLEQDRFDAAIGAITITGERLARVDFSYPAHRSGVAVAFARKTGLLSALSNYRAAASELGTLLAIILGLLVAIGGLMWARLNVRAAERSVRGSPRCKRCTTASIGRRSR